MALVPDGFDPGFASFGDIGITILVVLSGIIVAVVVFIFGWLILQRLQYKLTVNLWSKTGSGGVFTNDKARIIRDPTTRRPDVIEFRRMKLKEQYPGSDYLYYGDKGGMMLNGVVVDNKVVFFRVEELFPEPELFKVGYKQSDFHGLARSINDSENKWNPADFFSKYGPMLTSGVLVVVILIFMIVISNQLGTVSEAIERGLSSYGRALAGGSP